MTKSAHTKAPWRISCEEIRDGRLVYAADDRLVADCHGINVRSKEEEQANALLIAAAPDLLEALEAGLDAIMVAYELNDLHFQSLEKQYGTEIHGNIEHDEYIKSKETYEKAKAAILKATGGQSC